MQIIEEEQITSKDLLEEERMKAIQNLEEYQKETKSWYNKKVKPRQLSPGDFVLKKEKKRRYSWKVSTKMGRTLSYHKNKQIRSISLGKHEWRRN